MSLSLRLLGLVLCQVLAPRISEEIRALVARDDAVRVERHVGGKVVHLDVLHVDRAAHLRSRDTFGV